MPLRHAKISAKPDGPDNTLIQPSDWNADHVIPGQTAGDLIVRTASGWDRLGIGAAGQVLTVVGGAPAWATPTAVPDGNKGDITVAGASWTINTGAVTLAKLQTLNAARLVGRRAGVSGQAEEIQLLGPVGMSTSGQLMLNPGANGQVLSTVNGQALWQSIPDDLFANAPWLPLPTANWRSLVPHVGTGTALTLTSGRCYFMPFWVGMPRTVTELGVAVSTSASGTAEVAIYAADGPSMRPSTRLAYVSNLDTSTTGAKSGAVNLAMSPGLYWAALRASGAPGVRATANAFSWSVSTSAADRGTHLFHSDAALNSPTSDPTSIGVNIVPIVIARW